MTQHVRTSYRKHRKATWAAVLVVLAATALAVVLPATASQTVDTIPFPSDPLNSPSMRWSTGGGGTFSCSSVSSAATNTFFLSSPSSGTYDATASNGRSVKIGLTISSGGGPSVKDKYLSFKIIGGRISDIGIKGGTTVSTYDYGASASSWAEADGYGGGSSGTLNTTTGKIENLAVDTNSSNNKTGLHAPRDNSGNLYSISQLTICYEPTIKISGYVYRDSNASGTKDAGETGLSGRTVTLSDGSTAVTDPDGLYEVLVAPGTYTLCSAAQSGEVQSQPTPSSSCSGDGGWTASYTSDTPDQNFGFAGGVAGACAASGDGPLSSSLESASVTVTAKFQSVNGVCKVAGSDLAFTTYVQGGVRVAHLAPVGSLGTATCNINSGVGCQIVAQKITWSLSTTSPDTSALRYDDPPFNAAGDPRTMKFCLKDPLTGAADGVTLQAVGAGFFPVNILPSGETSCLIKTTQGPGPNPKRVDQVYSAYDGKTQLG